MALKVTQNLKDQIRTPNPEPTLVLKIDGYDRLFANIKLKRKIKIGDPGLLIGGGWVIGGLTELENVDAFLQLNKGTTTKITQKLDPSRGQGSSVSQMNFSLIDIGAEITQLISPGFVLSDILGRRITILTGARETAYPQDYNIVFKGTINALKSQANTVLLLASGTDEKKRISLLSNKQTSTTSDVDYRSATFQDILYKNRDDIANLVTVSYIGGGTAGAEVVSLTGVYDIQVQIENGVSTPSQIKRAVENDSESNQLVELKITGSSSNPQVIGSTSLGIDSVINGDFTNFLSPQDVMTTLAVIENELIEYTAKSPTQLTGVSRQVEGVAEYYENDKTINQVIRLQDHGITLALKIMLSGGPVYYAENVKIKSFEFYSVSTIIDNAIFFDIYDLEQEYGITAGDLITVTLATNGANNVIDAVVQEVGQAENGSYIILAEDLFTEGVTLAVAKFKSKYNKLPFGMKMLPNEVDIVQHEFVRDTFLPVFPMDLKIRTIDDGKSFLDEEIYKVMSCYSVPRKGRSSLVHTTAPLPTYEVITMDLTTVENPASLAVERSTSENFINQIQFAYDYDVINNEFKTYKNYPEIVDETRIPVGAKPFVIQSQGLTTANDADEITARMADRYLRRYIYGADFIKGVSVAFSVGYQLEIGDVVAVDYEALKLSDFNVGSREGMVKLMEIVNKTIDFKTMQVTVDLVNTIFGFGDRYGLISPASLTAAGSTTSKIKLQKSWSTKPFQLESTKYRDYIGQSIVVRTDDFSQVYTTKIRGFDTLVPQGMAIDPIATPPGENWIVECIPYPNDLDPRVEQFWKQRHAFFSPQVPVVSGVSQTEFVVSALLVGEFFIGSVVRVHNYDYTQDSGDVIVEDIVGNNIIVDRLLGFVPNSTHFVDLIGFPDKQQAYRIS